MLDDLSLSILGFVLGVALTALYYLHTVDRRLSRLENKTLDKTDEN